MLLDWAASQPDVARWLQELGCFWHGEDTWGRTGHQWWHDGAFQPNFIQSVWERMTKLCQRFCLDLFSIWKLDFKTHYWIRQWLVLDHRTVLHLQKHDLRPWWRAFRVLLPLAGKELHFGSSNDCSDSLVLTALNISKPVLTSTLQALERAD